MSAREFVMLVGPVRMHCGPLGWRVESRFGVHRGETLDAIVRELRAMVSKQEAAE